MRLHGQAQADLMWMRSLIHNAVSAVASRLSDLASSLAPVATSGSYDDLSGKPTLGALASQDAVTHSQVSDWDTATSGFAAASSLAPVATSGSYADLSGKPTLGALASLSSVTTSLISDWSTATSGFAADSGVVHKEGAENVTGAKTFGAEIRTSRAGSATHLRLVNTGITKGTAPTAQQNWYLPFSGSDFYNYGAIEVIARTNGEIVSRLYAFKNTAGSNATSAALGVVYPAATSPYATAPSTPVNSTGAQIVTADYLPKQGYVTADSTRLADIASHAGARLKNLAGAWGSAVQGIAYDAYDDVLYAIRNSGNGSYLVATRWSTNTRLATSSLFYAGWAHQGLALYRPTEDSPVRFFAGANKYTSSSASDASRLFRLNLNQWDYTSPTTYTTEHYWTLFDATVYNTGRDAMDVAISEDGTKLLAYAQKLSDSTWVAAVWSVSDILAAADGTNIYSLATVYDLPWGTSNVGGQGTALDSRYAYFLYSNSGTNPHYLWALSLESGSAVLVRDPSYEGFEIYGSDSSFVEGEALNFIQGRLCLAMMVMDSSTSTRLASIYDLQTAGEKLKSVTQKITIAASATYGLTVTLRRRDNLIICFLSGTANSIPKGAWATVATITDSSFIPSETTPYQTLVPQNKANEPFLVRVTTAGAIQVNPALAILDGYVNACIFYFAA